MTLWREAPIRRASERLADGLKAGDISLLHASNPVVLPVLAMFLDKLLRCALRAVSLGSTV